MGHGASQDELRLQVDSELPLQGPFHFTTIWRLVLFSQRSDVKRLIPTNENATSVQYLASRLLKPINRSGLD